jgi:hypothetical protein
LRWIGRTVGFGMLLTLLVGVGLIAASLSTYHALTAETLIAELRFVPAGPQRFDAYLRTGDRCEERVLPVLGDQWRVDAEFVKWKYWATVLLGLESEYRLDRLEGRYRSAAEQNSRPRQAHDLGPFTAIDVVELAEGLGRMNFLLDATYGSSTYREIDPSQIYEIYKTPAAIITRSRPAPPPPASGLAGLPVAVERACGEQPSSWQRWVARLDRTVAGWLGHSQS